MKWAVTLMAALAALGGWLAWRGPAPVVTDERAGLLAAFRERYRPATVLRGWPVDRELLDPSLALPHEQRYPFAEVSALYRYAKSCAGPPPHSTALAKAVLWARHRCRGVALPDGFFSTPPFRHPSGASYVRLAMEAGEHDREWLASHADRLGWGEWQLLRAHGIRLSSPQVLLGTLDSSQVRAVFDGEALVLGEPWLWLREPRARETGYAIYQRQQWDDFLQGTPFRTSIATPGARCLFRESNVCWQVQESARRDWAEIVALALAIALAAVGLVLGVLRWRDRQRAEAARRFLLRTLVHELRTPVTNLQLGMETFRGDFDRLPDASQEAFLRLCDEMQRLRRVLDASTQYLVSRESSSRIELRPIELPSINAYFERISTAFSPGVVFEPLADDRAFRVDAYWLGVCVRNLVVNAIDHGRPPVRLSLVAGGTALRITVRDEGTLPTRSLSKLTEAFHRRADSPGLGLGLGIVREVVGEMRGRLELNSAPTRFSILLEDVT